MPMSSASFSRRSSVMAADAPSAPAGGVRFWSLYAAAWVPFILVYALQIARSGADWSAALLGSALTIVPVAALGAVVLRLTIGRLSDLGRIASLLAHVGFAVVFAGTWCAIVIASIRIGAPSEVLEQFMREAVGWQFLSGLMLYAVLAGVGVAVRASRRLRAHEAAAARSEALRIRAELQALRARLDPHFLFNTLHTLMALVRSDRSRAEQALERFGDLLRYVLDVNRDELDEVALADEWAFVRDYLALEQLRLGARLTVREALDPDSLDVAIPAFTLQPLVENAIRHGIAPLPGGGTLTVASLLEGDTLRLEVRDDGAGTTASGRDAGGLGIRVVRQRLIARHGTAASVDVHGAPGAGFVAIVRLPAATTSRSRGVVDIPGEFALGMTASEPASGLT